MEAYTFQAPSGRTRRREKSCSQQRNAGAKTRVELVTQRSEGNGYHPLLNAY